MVLFVSQQFNKYGVLKTTHKANDQVIVSKLEPKQEDFAPPAPYTGKIIGN